MAADIYKEPATDKRGSIFGDVEKVAGFFRTAGIVGAVGLIVAGVLGGAKTANSVSGWNLVFQSYTFGYIFWLMFSLGCLGVQILASMLRATWAIAILRVAEAGASNLRYLFFLGLPLIASMFFGEQLGFHLYHWTSPEAKLDPILVFKSPYLNSWAVLARYALFFGIWIYYYTYLAEGKNGTHNQDRILDQKAANDLAQNRVNVAAPGFVVFGITITFFFTDLVMSLDPHWFSTIYGVWWGMVGVSSAIALGVIFLTSFHDRRPYDTIVTPGLTKDLGNMMFGMTMLWGYFSISQALIYWSGNLPEYVTFYYARFKGPMAFLGFAIVMGQFFTPFLLLLSGRTKRTPRYLCTVAIVIITVRIFDIWYQIIPFFNRSLTDVLAITVDLAAWAVVGGVWVTLFASHYRRSVPVVSYDTRLQEAKLDAHH
ncbi:MAG: hypothetical protein H7145_15490 [Akkermansiaceae bacterium]|nr:hypothetical protein [Armatimonadota bacterium]